MVTNYFEHFVDLEEKIFSIFDVRYNIRNQPWVCWQKRPMGCLGTPVLRWPQWGGVFGGSRAGCRSQAACTCCRSTSPDNRGNTFGARWQSPLSSVQSSSLPSRRQTHRGCSSRPSQLSGKWKSSICKSQWEWKRKRSDLIPHLINGDTFWTFCLTLHPLSKAA